jgi:hypothetical protein
MQVGTEVEDEGQRVGLVPCGEAGGDAVVRVANYEAVEEERLNVLGLIIDSDAGVEVIGVLLD